MLGEGGLLNAQTPGRVSVLLTHHKGGRCGGRARETHECSQESKEMPREGMQQLEGKGQDQPRTSGTKGTEPGVRKPCHPHPIGPPTRQGQPHGGDTWSAPLSWTNSRPRTKSEATSHTAPQKHGPRVPLNAQELRELRPKPLCPAHRAESRMVTTKPLLPRQRREV